jgi:ADP-heptose:LPS heptosyltransferase
MTLFNSVEPNRILIFRALQLGDLLCAVPAFRSLRAANPDAEITLVSLPWAKVFVDRYSKYIDKFVEFPGYPGLKECEPKLDQIPDFLKKIQAESYDLAIQMHGCGTITNPLVSMFKAKLTSGFYNPGQYCPDGELFLPYPEEEPEIWKNLRLIQKLGLPVKGEYLEFDVQRSDYNYLHSLEEVRSLKHRRYICIHPGARAKARRWPTEKFATIGDRISQLGFSIVLTGTSDEWDLANEVAEQMKEDSINLAGKTPLGSLAALLSGARLLICNDTGVSHLAAALRIPSVVIFPKSDRIGWPPLDRQLHRSVCRITGVTPEDVWVHAEGLIELSEQTDAA